MRGDPLRDAFGAWLPRSHQEIRFPNDCLVDPTPSRIENLVHELVMKRLLDGQFSDCGLTLKELHTVEQSLVKSLTAVYHGRVKYPDQQPV